MNENDRIAKTDLNTKPENIAGKGTTGNSGNIEIATGEKTATPGQVTNPNQFSHPQGS